MEFDRIDYDYLIKNNLADLWCNVDNDPIEINHFSLHEDLFKHRE